MEFWQKNEINLQNINASQKTAKINNHVSSAEDESVFSDYIKPDNTQQNYDNKTLEETFEGSVLQNLTEIQQNAHNIFEIQNQNDGYVSQGYNFIKETFNLGISDKDVQKALKKQDKDIEKLKKAYEKNDNESFKKVYKNITGVEFNPEKLLDFEQKTIELNFVQNQIDNARAFNNSLIEVKSTEELYDLYKNYYKDETIAREEIAEVIKESYNTYYSLGGVSEVKIDDKNNITITENGNEYSIGNLKDLNINGGQFQARLSIDYETKYIEQLEKTTGINYKELKEQYCKLHEEALGKGDSVYNLVEKYSKDQESFADKIAMVSQLSGLALMAGAGFLTAGGATAVFGAGQMLAVGGMFSDEALETFDIMTSKNNKDMDRYANVAKDAALDGVFLVSGGVIGASSSAIAADVLKSTNSQTLSLLAEIGSDATLSLLGDYILTGKIDISQETFSQFIGIITGISASKNAYKNSYTPQGNIKEKTEFLNKKAKSAASVELKRNELFTRLEDLSLKDVGYREEVVKAAKAKNTTYNLDRIADAVDFIDKGENYKNVLKYAQEIYDTTSDPSQIKETMTELTDGLKIETTSEIDKIENHDIYIQTGENEVITGRTKGYDSIFSKIKNKILKLDTDMPLNANEAMNLIADLQGTRVVFDPNKIEIDTSALDIQGIDKADRIAFFDFIRNKIQPEDLSEEKIKLFKAHEQEGLLALSEAQSSRFIDNFSSAIEKDEIRIKEIHNYAPKDGVAYLTDSQIKKLQSAYSNWFNEKLQKAKNGTGDLEIVERQGKTILYDPETKIEYNQEMEIVTAYVDKKAHRDNGYTCAQFNLVNSKGQLEEFQYRGKLVDAKAEREHKIYDIINNKTTADKPENDLIKEQIKILEDNNAFDEYNKYVHDLFLYERKKELGVTGMKEPKIEDYRLIQDTLNQASRLNDKNYDINLLSINPN